MLESLWISILFFVGLCVGSFVNVCIWRLPAQEQVVRGRSHCRSCGATIPWYDNLPLVGFVLLKGRCRFCRAKISWWYPAVELSMGLLFLAVVARFGWTGQAAIAAALGASLLLVSVVDAREMLIPDEVTIPGLQLGVVVSFFYPVLHGSDGRWGSLISSVVGALTGAGFLLAVGALGSWIFKREAMGGGDVKLMAYVGSVIGWQKALLVNLILAPLFGSVVGIVLKYVYKRDLIPYGPFLALGTLGAVFWGDGIFEWYRGLIGF